ncbi:MAG: hypothetical protein MK008_05235 [Bdellovibrionales bacterium]|nr:hypothetical protein [Bdellovibrionales bacterium]
MLSKSLIILLFVPQLCFASVCMQLFPQYSERASITTFTLLEQLEAGKQLSTESLYHLTDMVTSSKTSMPLIAQTHKLLRSLNRHDNPSLRATSYDILTRDFQAHVNFFEFFKNKAEIKKYLTKRQKAFEELNQLPTAIEIINVFKHYTLDKPIRLTEYLKTFDQNGYFYISKNELQKLLEQSPSIYSRVLHELKAFDSRVHPDQLYQSFKNKRLMQDHELVFKPTIEAIEQQKIKLKKSDFQFLMQNVDVNSKQVVVWTQVLSYINRYPKAYINEFIGDGGFFSTLLSRVDLANPFGRMLYQQLFISLERFDYQMTQAELQLSFSLLTNYKPMPFNAQTRLSGLFRYEFESPVELFYNYLSRQPFKLHMSQKNQALHMLEVNLSTVPYEASFVKRLAELIEI